MEAYNSNEFCKTSLDSVYKGIVTELFILSIVHLS